MASDGTTCSTTETSWLYRPVFPESWESHVLYSLATWINGMAFKSIDFTPTGRPVIKIAEIKGGITAQTQFTHSEYDKRYFITQGDMLFSWSGQPETSIDAFYWDGPDGWLNQHVFKVLPDDVSCTPSFLFYILKYLKPNFIGIARNKQTTGLGHVTKADMQAIQVAVPDRPTQDRITYVLGKLDAHIAVNLQMNRTLEKMAGAIFKSWFIDFDPVHAKAEGRDTGLPAEIDDLFPNGFEESKLGNIPRGWSVSGLGDLIELAYGRSLRAQDRRPGPVAVYGSSGQVGWHDTELVRGPGVVVGRKGNSGSVIWVPSEFFPIDTTFYVICKAPLPSLYFMFHALRVHNLPILGADSAVPGLNRNMVYMSRQVVPSSDLVTAFDSFVKPLYHRIHTCERQNRHLSGLRDTLLPKLMSGEIDIPETVSTNREAL